MEIGWFNPYGLLLISVIMIPNLIFAAKCRDGFQNKWNHPVVEAVEQIGRFGCFGLMIFNIPGLCLGFPSPGAQRAYWIADAVLAALYCLIWAICFKRSSMFRALALSILPSALFLFSGVMLRSLPLTVAALLFAPSHIAISCRNAM